MATWTFVRAELKEAPEDWSWLAEVFSDHGANGTVQTDHPPTLGGYVSDPEQVDCLREALRAVGAEVEACEVPEEDWSECWKQYFKPRRIGRNLVVRPVWESYEPEPGDRVIVLDPGQAFGTGDHPTTRMCLEWLEQLEVAGMELADIGCGTGILAIGTLLMGAARVDAVDCDPLSIESTRENVARNGVTLSPMVGEGFTPLGESTYDGVVSNIISAALIRLAPEVARRVRPGGWWLASGIIEGNWSEVRAAAERAGFALVEMRQEGEWMAAHFRR